MLHIRLTRVGKKKQPTYRVIITEKHRDPWGKVLEILGHYNPRSKDKAAVLKADRIKYWIEHGAQASSTVHNLLLREGIISGKKRSSVKISKKRQAKKDERKKADQAAEQTKEEASKKEKQEIKEKEQTRTELETPKEEKVEELKEKTGEKEQVEQEKTEEKKEESEEKTESEDKKPEIAPLTNQ